jgi:hypothetical protein
MPMRVCRSHVRAGLCAWVLALPGLSASAAPLIPLEQFAAGPQMRLTLYRKLEAFLAANLGAP